MTRMWLCNNPRSTSTPHARRLEPAPEARWEPPGTRDHSTRTRFIRRASRTRTRLNRSILKYLMICRKLYAHNGTVLLNSGSGHGKPRRCFLLRVFSGEDLVCYSYGAGYCIRQEPDGTETRSGGTIDEDALNRPFPFMLLVNNLNESDSSTGCLQ